MSCKHNFWIYFLTGICLLFLGWHLCCQLPQISLITPIPQISSAKVIRVIDGDTIEIDTGQKVRYIGIDSAEVYPTEQCFSKEAKEENEKLVLGKEVKLVKDVSDADKYGRLLRYIYIDDEYSPSHPELVSGSLFVNDYLVKNGFAKIMTIMPDTQYQNQFKESEDYAKKNKSGLWSKCLI